MLFRTIINSTKILFIYPLIQPPSPKIKIPQNSNFYGVGSEYVKDGKELIVNALTNQGVSCTTNDTFLQLANKIDTMNQGLQLSEWSDIVTIEETVHLPRNAKAIFATTAYPMKDPACQEYPSRNQLDPAYLLNTPATGNYTSINNVVLFLPKATGVESYAGRAVNTYNGYSGGGAIGIRVDWDTYTLVCYGDGSNFIPSYGCMWCYLY